jgi:hypothetical protein
VAEPCRVAVEAPPGPAARLAGFALRSQRLLEEGSADEIATFVYGQMTHDGGFRGRAPASDLYYTYFAAECLRALGRPLPKPALAQYLSGFGAGEGLDLVHRCCLACCLMRVHGAVEDARRVVAGLAQLAHPDGGYRATLDGAQAAITASLLTVIAHEDCGVAVPDPDGILVWVNRCRTSDGAWADHPGCAVGTTTATAAATLLCLALGSRVDEGVAEWLLARHSDRGGFFATPGAPIPDLLSSACAAVALRALGRDLDVEALLSFVEDRFAEGGFAAHDLDPVPDCEYCYYALLALGAAVGGR